MARIDRFLHPLSRPGADRLIMSAGEKAAIATPAGLQAVTAEAVTALQIMDFVREILPPAMAPALSSGQGCEFIYASPVGGMRVRTSGEDGTLRLEVAPARPLPAARPAAAAPAPPALYALLTRLVNEKGSDLHLTTGNHPLFRKDGDIVSLDDMAPLAAEQVRELLSGVTPSHHMEQFEKTHDADFSLEIAGLARFRCNLFMDRLGMGGVFRVIPTKIPTVEDLGLSKAILDMCQLNKGFIAVTGPTGSGKSTTLAAMIDYINRTRSLHIITIEDPIEFVHTNRRCLVNQREVGTHTQGFKHALRAALREDPDIVMVGEMRDLETVAIALETAETGHLVFGTLHTNTAPSTVDRIIDQFPADRQAQVRTILSESLKGVLSQALCKKKGGGRVAAIEVLVVNAAASNLIREGKTFQIPSIMQTGKGLGMVCLNDALADLVSRGLVDPAEASAKAVGKAEFKSLLARTGARAEVA